MTTHVLSQAASTQTLSQRRQHGALLAALLVAVLLPIWLLPIFATQDGPVHLHNADLLRRMALGEGRLHEFYWIKWTPKPNVLGHLLLMGLLTVATPLVADKILLSLLLVGGALAGRYAMRAISPGRDFLALLLVPLLLNRLLYLGFYNFCLGVVLLLVLLGYWIGNQDRMTWWRGAILGVMGIGLHLSHLSVAMVALVSVGALLLASVGQKGFAQRALITAIALLPTAVLVGGYTLAYAPPAEQPVVSLTQRVRDLATFDVLASLHPLEIYVGMAMAVLLLVLLLRAAVVRVRWRRLNQFDALLLCAGVLLAGYFWQRGRTAENLFVPERALVLVGLVLVLWLAANPWGRLAQTAVPLAATVLTLALAGSQWRVMRQLQPTLAEFVSVATRIAPGKTMVVLNFSPEGPGRRQGPVLPLLHASSYIAIARQAIDLGNYEAMTGHFQLRFHARRDPIIHRAYIEWTWHSAPDADISNYERASGAKVDYVLVWGDEKATTRMSQRLSRKLQGDYHLIEHSQPHGWMRLYERNPGVAVR
jgi:hypothetical protein